MAGVGLIFIFFKSPSGLLKWQLVFSTLWILALCREGAAENYYMEFLLYGLVWMGEAWSSPSAFPLRFRPFLPLAPVLGLVCLSLLPGPWVPPAQEAMDKARLLPLEALPGEPLSLDTDLPYMVGKGMAYQYSGLMPLVREGLWDPGTLDSGHPGPAVLLGGTLRHPPAISFARGGHGGGREELPCGFKSLWPALVPAQPDLIRVLGPLYLSDFLFHGPGQVKFASGNTRNHVVWSIFQ